MTRSELKRYKELVAEACENAPVTEALDLAEKKLIHEFLASCKVSLSEPIKPREEEEWYEPLRMPEDVVRHHLEGEAFPTTDHERIGEYVAIADDSVVLLCYGRVRDSLNPAALRINRIYWLDFDELPSWESYDDAHLRSKFWMTPDMLSQFHIGRELLLRRHGYVPGRDNRHWVKQGAKTVMSKSAI